MSGTGPFAPAGSAGDRSPAPGTEAGLPASRGRFGVYVHIPFCRRRCDYCAFATYADRDHLAGRYVSACVAELRRAGAEEGIPPASSVFFGGGTPSRLAPGQLAAILDAVVRLPGAEVTVECNPEDASVERFVAYRDAGVTRLSLGVQSTAPHVLGALGRVHDPDAPRRAVAMAAAAGIDELNVDLIYGAVGETDEDWVRTLHDVLSFPGPLTHVSAYALTVEPGTPLAATPDRYPDDDAQATRYELADTVLSAAGFEWEEVSNWARPGHRCRHNQLYWAQGDYRGIGSSAHSHQSGTRWWNVRTPDRYVRSVESGQPAVAGAEHLDPGRRAVEALMLSLRTPAGVPEAALPEAPELEGLVVRAGGRAVLTRRGRLLANAVTRLLAVPGDAEPARGDRYSALP